MRFVSISRAAAVCLALAACDSATGSQPLSGTYTLASAAGRPVPAAVDSVVWADGVTYTLDVVVGSSVEIAGADSARYTVSERRVTHYASGQTAFEATCTSLLVQYRVRGDDLFLVLGPDQFGHTGRLQVHALRIGDNRLVAETRNGSGTPLRLEYVPAAQPARCDTPSP